MKKLPPCMNCGTPVSEADVLIRQAKVVIGTVCTRCVRGVAKLRVTMFRDTPEHLYSDPQYDCVEVFDTI